MTSFYLPSKRLVSIESVSISSIYANVLEGTPDAISQHYRAHFAENLQRGYGARLVIVEPPEGRLPAYRVVVNLVSDPVVRDDFLSSVVLCWFQRSLAENLVEAIERIAADLDWEKISTGWGG